MPTFLFRRDYMDYHADRFEDHSLMIYDDHHLLSLLPANRGRDGGLVSHAGLSYGGFVLPPLVTTMSVLALIRASLAWLNSRGIATLRLKRIPRFYCSLPDDEIDYAMFLLDADLVRRDTALVIEPGNRLPLRKGKKSTLTRAAREGISLTEDSDFGTFWEQVLVPRLHDRYGVRPVHTVAEISQLAARLPQHIKQYSAYRDGRILAGVTIFETPTVAHAQYSAANDEGRERGALDLLTDWLISTRYEDKRYVDLGICNEAEGRMLNPGLLRSKEGLGGRALTQDFYDIRTADGVRLDSVLQLREAPATTPL